MQHLLAVLYTDAALRQRFSIAPESVAEEFGIDAAAARQLADLPSAQVGGFARSLLRKRMNEVGRLLPATSRVLGARFAPLFESHAAQFQPQGLRRHFDDAVAFAAFLSRSQDIVVREADVARYEVLRLRFRQGRVWPLLAMFRTDPRDAATGGAGTGGNRWLLACWFRFGGRVRHVAIRLPRVWKGGSGLPA